MSGAWRKRLGAGLMVLVPLTVGVFAFATAAKPAVVPAVFPGDGAVLSAAPPAVRLDVPEADRLREFHLNVSTASGASVTCAEVAVASSRAIQVPVCITEQGSYQVAYHVRFADGRDLVGATTFRIAPDGTAPVDAAPLGSGGHVHNDDPLTYVLTGLAVVSILALLVLMFSRPRLRQDRT